MQFTHMFGAQKTHFREIFFLRIIRVQDDSVGIANPKEARRMSPFVAVPDAPSLLVCG